MDWWNVSVFGIIPVFTVALIFFIKRKLLWTAPLISTMISAIISVIAVPDILSEGEYRALFRIGLLLHFAIVVLLTAIAYIIALTLKRKQDQ